MDGASPWLLKPDKSSGRRLEEITSSSGSVLAEEPQLPEASRGEVRWGCKVCCREEPPQLSCSPMRMQAPRRRHRACTGTERV